MGFRYRKSINLGGGFRVNLSKNGIGYSWGVKGYRITKTADGRVRRTASIPGTGISYVEEHQSSRPTPKAEKPQVDPLAEYADVQAVNSASMEKLSSDEYEQLFKNIKFYKVGVTILVIAMILSLAAPPLCIAFAIAFIVFCSKARCKIVYEFDDYQQERWERLSEAWRGVASSDVLHEIVLTAKAKNKRVTAGIETGVQTEKVTGGGKLPNYLTTNISPVVFTFKDKRMAILPDRLLVVEKNKMAAIDYRDVKFDLSAVGYLESENAPKDSELIKYVWAYANKDGSPDKRYSNNKQYPVMKYGKIVITSSSGLNIQFLCSDEAAADNLNELINNK